MNGLRLRISNNDVLLEELVKLENDIATNEANDTVWVGYCETASERIYRILQDFGATEHIKRLSIYQGEEL